jgi:hypothetical protein
MQSQPIKIKYVPNEEQHEIDMKMLLNIHEEVWSENPWVTKRMKSSFPLKTNSLLLKAYYEIRDMSCLVYSQIHMAPLT